MWGVSAFLVGNAVPLTGTDYNHAALTVLPFAPHIKFFIFWVSKSQIFVYSTSQVIFAVTIFVSSSEILLVLPLPLCCHSALLKFLQCFLKLPAFTFPGFMRVLWCKQNARKALLQKQVSCLSAISAPSPTGAGLTFKAIFLWAASGTQKGRWKGHSHPSLLSTVIFTQDILPWKLPLVSALSQNNLSKGKGGVFDQYSQLLTKPSMTFLTNQETHEEFSAKLWQPGYPESCFLTCLLSGNSQMCS